MKLLLSLGYKYFVRRYISFCYRVESDRGQPLDGNHQFIKFNVQGKGKFKVNSGFVKEAMNETFKQLLLSERAWIYKDQIFTPVNVSNTNIEYKTRQKDRLINYEFEFDYAFNEINNIW